MSWDDWSKGVCLADVHLRFGDRKLIERYNNLENPNSSDKLLSRMLEIVDKGVTGFAALGGKVLLLQSLSHFSLIE